MTIMTYNNTANTLRRLKPHETEAPEEPDQNEEGAEHDMKKAQPSHIGQMMKMTLIPHEFYTTLTQAIDEVVDQANETQTPVKLTFNEEGTKVIFELVSV